MNHEARMRFADSVGAHMTEEHSMPHMAGRVMGALLISVPPERSIEELAQDLHASIGAMSMSTRELLRTKIIERVNRPGERRHYYRIRPDFWSKMYLERLDNVRAHMEMAEQGLALLTDEPPEMKERLVEMWAFFRYLTEILPEAADRWKDRRDALIEELEVQLDRSSRAADSA